MEKAKQKKRTRVCTFLRKDNDNHTIEWIPDSVTDSAINECTVISEALATRVSWSETWQDGGGRNCGVMLTTFFAYITRHSPLPLSSDSTGFILHICI